ncbi:asparagine synthase-related protein [Luteibacter sp. PPL201]|uniref:asparagine synthase (glutamine-hydrolyzing) n=1 Tax=Luteibacter sahnii TaxID=3021977 RepID=A0ABT6BBY5_9GAMM
MILAERDPFGFRRVVYHVASATVGERVDEVAARASLAERGIDVAACQGYFSGRRLHDRTVMRDIRQLAPGQRLQVSADGWQATDASPPTPASDDLEAALLDAVHRAVEGPGRTAIALSGGLDSALLLGLLHAHGHRDVPAYVLATGMPDYDERDAALATARRLGMDVIVVNACEADFVDALPQVMRHVDEPLYNLHPVAKWLLAAAMRRDGVVRAISGDGVDQVMRRDTSADYLPLCRTLFQAQGVALHPPFLAPDVVGHLLARPPDPEKTCIRELGQRHGVARELVTGPKRSRLAPPMDLRALLPPGRADALAHALGWPPPDLTDDRARVQWTTLMQLLDRLRMRA